MEISVVIPTKNRLQDLMRLLLSLEQNDYKRLEVIIVDASDVRMDESQLRTEFPKLKIIYLPSPSSVCVQRNLGIHHAKADWIFVCDDDIEIPRDYLSILVNYVLQHPDAGAICGQILQLENHQWQSNYPLSSKKELLLKFCFGLGIWGPVTCSSRNPIIQWIVSYYRKKGNHLAKSGWPIITHFEGDVIAVPSFTLCAALIKKQWLEISGYDEVLDSHGIGDNYGIALSFPAPGIQVIQSTFAYHYKVPENRIQKPVQYYRRALALDYFIRTNSRLRFVKRRYFLFSLFGNAFIYILKGDHQMRVPALKTFWRALFKRNPYVSASIAGEKVTEFGL